jgi:hypothetical protein
VVEMKYEQNYRKASQAALVPYNQLVAVGSFTELFAVSPMYKESTKFAYPVTGYFIG